LQETIGWFKEVIWTFIIDGNYRTPEEMALNELLEKKTVQRLGLQLRLLGFTKAGVETFNIWATLEEFN